MSGNEKTSSDRAMAVAVAVASSCNSERRHGVPSSSLGLRVERLKDRLRALEEEDDVAKQDFYESLHEINKLMTETRHHLHQSRVGTVRLLQHGIGRGRAAGIGGVQTSAVVMIRDIRAAMEEGSNKAACQ